MTHRLATGAVDECRWIPHTENQHKVEEEPDDVCECCRVGDSLWYNPGRVLGFLGDPDIKTKY